MPYKELTEKHLNKLKGKIINTLQSKGVDNTGQAANSLEIKDNILFGADYIYFLVHGRAPGNFPPVQNMRDWVRSKLSIDSEKVNGVAYLVGRKIANEGTEIYKDNSKGLELDNLINETLNDLHKELPDAATVELFKFLGL